MSGMQKRVQAKDIADVDVLSAVDASAPTWATTSDLETRLFSYPAKVVRAKARSLVLRGFLTGCSSPSCIRVPCRGEYELTAVGRELLRSR